jgi:hypothetical protein
MLMKLFFLLLYFLFSNNLLFLEPQKHYIFMSKAIVALLITFTLLGHYAQAQVAPFKKGDRVAITKFNFSDFAGVFNEQTATCCGDGEDSSSVRTIEAIIRSAEAMLAEKYKIEIEPAEIKPNSNPKLKFKEEVNCAPTTSAKDAAKMGYSKFVEVYVSFDASAGAQMGIGFVRLGNGKAKIKVMHKIYDGKGKLLSFSKPQTAKGDQKYKVRGFLTVGGSQYGGNRMLKPKSSFPGDEYVILFQEAFGQCLELK